MDAFVTRMSGTAGLIRALLSRLGLDEPVVRHKLRILASSASLPTTFRPLRPIPKTVVAFGRRGAERTEEPVEILQAAVTLVDVLVPDGSLLKTVPDTPAVREAVEACHRALIEARTGAPAPSRPSGRPPYRLRRDDRRSCLRSSPAASPARDGSLLKTVPDTPAVREAVEACHRALIEARTSERRSGCPEPRIPPIATDPENRRRLRSSRCRTDRRTRASLERY
jgi:hypothetical protein